MTFEQSLYYEQIVAEAYRRWPDPHNTDDGSLRYGFIEGCRWYWELKKAAIESYVDNYAAQAKDAHNAFVATTLANTP